MEYPKSLIFLTLGDDVVIFAVGGDWVDAVLLRRERLQYNLMPMGMSCTDAFDAVLRRKPLKPLQ